MHKSTAAIIFTLALTAACGNARTSSGTTADTAAAAVAERQEGTPSDLPLPDVPENLVQPRERANYIILHFWDAMDFSDTARSHDSLFIEQTFANFISVFPYADEPSRRAAAEGLLRKAGVDAEARTLLIDTAETYLYDLDSPMFSEDFYIVFLEAVLNDSSIDDIDKIRPRYQLEAALKNRPGTRAADFSYITRDGRLRTLHGTATGKYLLIVFYDPDCDHCNEVTALLASEPQLDSRIDDGTLTVLAVDADGNRELWNSTRDRLPASWIAGFETGALYDRGLYILRSMPSLYLLDESKSVILKDAKPEQLTDFLSEN